MYCKTSKSVTEQIDEGISFFKEKYPEQLYLAYFQAYTNTYGSIEKIRSMCEEALSHPKVTGLVIATRPDCIDEKKLDYIESLAEKHYITIEYGIETFNDKTLDVINRGHTSEETIHAIALTQNRGINIGAHMILGLPGEDHNIIINNAKEISSLPVKFLKLHQLQIIKNTRIAELFYDKPGLFMPLTIDKYIELVIDFLEILNPEIIVERFTSESPADMVISPDWNGLKNFEITSMIEKRMNQRNTWQGIRFN
jgi:uncharacterized protein